MFCYILSSRAKPAEDLRQQLIRFLTQGDVFLTNLTEACAAWNGALESLDKQVSAAFPIHTAPHQRPNGDTTLFDDENANNNSSKPCLKVSSSVYRCARISGTFTWSAGTILREMRHSCGSALSPVGPLVQRLKENLSVKHQTLLKANSTSNHQQYITARNSFIEAKSQVEQCLAVLKKRLKHKKENPLMRLRSNIAFFNCAYALDVFHRQLALFNEAGEHRSKEVAQEIYLLLNMILSMRKAVFSVIEDFVITVFEGFKEIHSRYMALLAECEKWEDTKTTTEEEPNAGTENHPSPFGLDCSRPAATRASEQSALKISHSRIRQHCRRMRRAADLLMFMSQASAALAATFPDIEDLVHNNNYNKFNTVDNPPLIGPLEILGRSSRLEALCETFYQVRTRFTTLSEGLNTLADDITTLRNQLQDALSHAENTEVTAVADHHGAVCRREQEAKSILQSLQRQHEQDSVDLMKDIATSTGDQEIRLAFRVRAIKTQLDTTEAQCISELHRKAIFFFKSMGDGFERGASRINAQLDAIRGITLVEEEDLTAVVRALGFTLREEQVGEMSAITLETTSPRCQILAAKEVSPTFADWEAWVEESSTVKFESRAVRDYITPCGTEIEKGDLLKILIPCGAASWTVVHNKTSNKIQLPPEIIDVPSESLWLLKGPIPLEKAELRFNLSSPEHCLLPRDQWCAKQIETDHEVPADLLKTMRGGFIVHNSGLKRPPRKLKENRSSTTITPIPPLEVYTSLANDAGFAFQVENMGAVSTELSMRYNIQEEPVVGQFSCALSRKILLHGKLYVTPRCLAFYSVFNDLTIFGVDPTCLLIYWADVVSIKRKNVALFIPNSIQFNMANGQTHFFASFPARDRTLQFFMQVWQHSRQPVLPAVKRAVEPWMWKIRQATDINPLWTYNPEIILEDAMAPPFPEKPLKVVEPLLIIEKPLQTIVNDLFVDPAFMKGFLESSGCELITVDGASAAVWDPPPFDETTKKRPTKSHSFWRDNPRNALTAMMRFPARSKVEETSVMFFYAKDRLLIESVAQAVNMPFGDYFTVVVRYRIIAVSENETQIDIERDIHWSKSTCLKAKIEAEVASSTIQSLKLFEREVFARFGTDGVVLQDSPIDATATNIATPVGRRLRRPSLKAFCSTAFVCLLNVIAGCIIRLFSKEVIQVTFKCAELVVLTGIMVALWRLGTKLEYFIDSK